MTQTIDTYTLSERYARTVLGDREVPASASVQKALRIGYAAKGVAPGRLPRTPATELAQSLPTFPQLVAELAVLDGVFPRAEASAVGRAACGLLATSSTVPEEWQTVLQRVADGRETSKDIERIVRDDSGAAALAQDAVDPLDGYWGGLKRLGPYLETDEPLARAFAALIGGRVRLYHSQKEFGQLFYGGRERHTIARHIQNGRIDADVLYGGARHIIPARAVHGAIAWPDMPESFSAAEFGILANRATRSVEFKRRKGQLPVPEVPTEADHDARLGLRVDSSIVKRLLGISAGLFDGPQPA